MRNVIKRVSFPITGISILFAFVLISLTATVGSSSIFSYTHIEEENSASADENVAAKSSSANEETAADSGMSYANADDQNNLYTEIPGVGAFFGNMLDSLINLTKDSENRFRSLTHHFPLVFPDLYKVFITL